MKINGPFDFKSMSQKALKHLNNMFYLYTAQGGSPIYLSAHITSAKNY